MRFFVVFFVTAACLVSAKDADARIDWSVPVAASCVRALDGDSLIVRAAWRSLEVRLVGIDAPEHGQEWGEASRNELIRLCGSGNALTLERDRDLRDRYGRYLLWVWAGDKLLNEHMVRAGLALPLHIPPNGAYRKRIDEAQDAARHDRSGFWSKGGLEMTPSKWRRKNPR